MERIVGLIACLLCAIPFLIIACFGKDSQTPISFWASDTSLSDKVTDLSEYNSRMAKLYGRCAAIFAATGLCCLVSMAVAIVLIFAESTVGIYIAYRAYKKILVSCSDMDKEG